MKKKKNRPPLYNKGKRMEITKMMLTCGIVSYSGLGMLEGEKRLYARKIKDMQTEGTVEIVKCCGKRVARFRRFEENSEIFISQYPKGYYGHYIKYGQQNGQNAVKTGSDRNKAERAYRESEVQMMMYGAGVGTLYEDRPKLRQGEELPNVEEYGYYYSSNELKGIDSNGQMRKKEEKAKINSRAYGCLVSSGGDYIVYHIGNRMQKWSPMVEGQMRYVMSEAVRGIRRKEKRKDMDECILTYYGNSTAVRLVDTDNSKNGYVNLNSGYKHMYILPYDENGKEMLRLMKSKDWKERIYSSCIDGLERTDSRSSIDCDALCGDKKIFVFCVPDIIRLNRFLIASMWSGKPKDFEVVCYEWQRELVEMITKGNVVIRIV